MAFISPQPCGGSMSSGCGCCPVASSGLCLPNGTPIAIVFEGAILQGWINELNGVFTPGPPPSGTASCSSSGEISVHLTCETDSVTVCQGTIPWEVSGALTVDINYEYPEDSPHVSGDIGAFVLAVRNDTAAVLTSANGDYSPFAVDSAGRIGITDLGGSISVDDGGGSLTVDGTVTVLQGTSPWVVSATDLDIRNLACGQDAVDACVTFDYAEDTPHVSGDIGAFVLAVRNDSGTPLAGDGDYIPFTTDNTGALRVNVTSVGGTFNAAFQYPEDSPSVSGDIGAFVLAVRNDTHAVLTSTDLDYSAIAVDSDGAVQISDGGNSITVDGTVTVLQGTSPWVVSGAVTATGAYTPSDVQPNPTNLIGTEDFNMIWNPGAVSGTPEWSRWGVYGIDDDSAGTGRAPGVSIFGRPELGFGETPQQAGVISNLLDNAEASHGLVVASEAHFRDGNTPVLGRQSDGAVDNNNNKVVGATGNMVYDAVGDNWDRSREATSNGMTAIGIPASGTMIFNGATWDRWTGAVTQGTSPWVVSGTVTSVGTKTFTDAYANPTDNIDTISLTGGFNGTTWDRARSTGDNADGVAVITLGELLTISRNTVFNGTTWDRMRSGTATGSVLVNNPTAANLLATVNQGTSPWVVSGTVAVTQSTSPWIVAGAKTLTDAYANPTDDVDVASLVAGFNGTTWDRQRSTGDNADGVAVATLGEAIVVDRNTVFNGTTWDRMRSGTATGSVLVNNGVAANFLATVTTAYQFAEDSGHVSGNIGAFVLAVRNDTGAVLAGTDLDYIPFTTDATGALRVTGTSTVVGSKTFTDAYANPTDNLDTISLTGGFNGTTWDRARSTGDNADAVAVATLGELIVVDRNTIFNGTTWDRWRTAPGVTGAGAIGGPTAADGVLAVAPVTIGGRASTVVPTDVSTDGDVVNLWTEKSGRLRVFNSRRNRSGIYHATTPLSTVTLAADAATGGRWWLVVNTGATTFAAIRRIAFTSQSATALVTLTTPIFTVERFTTTTNPTGAQITPAKRDSTDAANTATFRTANTGLTITAGAAAEGFVTHSVLTAIGSVPVNKQQWPREGTDEEEFLVLRAGEGIVVRQSTAGTLADTRTVQIDIIWEEWS